MFLTTTWKDFEVLDTGDGEKLERWGDVILRRPDPQTIWPKADPALWRQAQAWYHRSDKGGGEWEFFSRLPEKWVIAHEALRFYVRPTGFKHTGLFPEQAANWVWMAEKLRQSGRKDLRVLNLFGYTGGATLACAQAGAHVTHVDAAKGMVQWAKENRELSQLPETSCRWIVEDALRFVQREIRRGNSYDGILMDPPSYGRGPGGEIWKLEDNVYDLIALTAQVLTDDPLFFAVNSYTEGLSPAVMEYIVKTTLCPVHGGHTHCDEIGLPVSATGGVVPCGATAIWEK